MEALKQDRADTDYLHYKGRIIDYSTAYTRCRIDSFKGNSVFDQDLMEDG